MISPKKATTHITTIGMLTPIATAFVLSKALEKNKIIDK